jgi:hypothetical protein
LSSLNLLIGLLVVYSNPELSGAWYAFMVMAWLVSIVFDGMLSASIQKAVLDRWFQREQTRNSAGIQGTIRGGKDVD